MENFKIEETDEGFSYVKNDLSVFRYYIRIDIENPVGCSFVAGFHTRIKLKTIHSKLIKIMFDS